MARDSDTDRYAVQWTTTDDDKFNTVVEAMYPGHRDAPPPPPGSHAFRILKQLMSSADGWRAYFHQPWEHRRDNNIHDPFDITHSQT